MDAATALNAVVLAVETLAKLEPYAVKLVSDLKPFAISFYQRLTGTVPTDAEIAEIEAKIDALHAELQEPMPPEDAS